jgi:hypothetical protein
MPPGEPLYGELPVAAMALEAAREGLFRDRRRFFGLLAAMEHRAAELELVLGGDPGIGLLLGRPPGLNDNVLPFYAEDPEAAARALAMAAYREAPHAEGRYARVEAEEAGVLYTLKAEDRAVGQVQALPKHRGRSVPGALGARPCSAAEAREGCPLPPPLLVFPAEVQLVQVYASLCDPGRASHWADLLGLEEELRAALPPPPPPAPPPPSWGKPVARFLAAVVSEFFPGERRVALPPPRGLRAGRLRAISARGLGLERRTLTALAQKAGVPVESAIHVVEVPGTSPQRRLTIYHAPGGRRAACLDLYDSAERELVPTCAAAATPPHREGTLFVRLRYELTELWTVQYLARAGEVASEPGERLAGERLRAFHALAAEYARARAEGAGARLLPTASEAYVGCRLDPLVAAKRARLGRSLPPPWYPCRGGAQDGPAGPGGGGEAPRPDSDQ